MIYPWLYLLLALSVGIAVNSYLNIHIPVLSILLLLIFSFFLQSIYSYALLILSSLLIGMSIVHKEKIDIQTSPVFVECISTSVPVKFDRFYTFSCKVVSSDVYELKGKSITVKTQESDVFLLSRVAFFADLKVDSDSIKAYTKKDFTIVDNSDNPVYWLKKFKDRLIERYSYNALNRDSFSLGVGLVFGERSEIGMDEYQKFITSGLAHFLAISGSHVAILMVVLLFFLSFLPHSWRYATVMALLPLYAIFTGMSIPVVRAVIMGFLFCIAKLKYFKFNSLNVLFLTGYVYLLLSPESLFSPSFQLSFMAVLGILLGLENLKTGKFWIDILIISLLATVFTMPVVMYHFGNVSLNSILSTPIASIPMYPYLFLAFINVFTGFTLTPLVKLMDGFGMIFLQIANIFEKIPLYYVGFSPSVFLVILFYIALIGVILSKLSLERKLLAFLPLILTFSFFSKTPTREFAIYSFKGRDYPTVLVVNQDRCYLITDFPVYRQLSLFNKEGCRERFLITQKVENFRDDYLSQFSQIFSYTYQVETPDFKLKRWVEYRLYRNSKEYKITNQDALIDSQ